MENNNNRMLFGLVVIFLGFAFLSDTVGLSSVFGINTGELIGTFWPLILVFIGITMLSRRQSWPGLILSILGTGLLLSNVFGVSFWGLFWSILLIVAGFMILTNNTFMSRNSQSGKRSTDELNESVMFWGLEQKIASDDFKGGKISCLFGGAEIDLSEVKLDKDGARLDIDCGFGGVELILPENITIKSNGTAFLGAWENNLNSAEGKNIPTLEITGTVYFGGVEIKN